jgi:glycosyltransferase involved in cell wall biosynthesis
MKICVVTPRFSIAGVPLAQIRFARALLDQGHEVELMIGYVDPKCQLPDVGGVKVIVLNKPNVRNMLLPIWRYLRSVKPDIVFSAEDHLNIVVLIAAIASRTKARISGSSRVTPYDTYSSVPFTKRWILKQIMRTVAWRADALTCVSKDMVLQYKSLFPSLSHTDVYNIVDDKLSRQRMREPVKHEWLTNEGPPILVAAGKLAVWKGFSDLIYAIKDLSNRRSVRLLILGDGPLRYDLEALIADLGLSDVVTLLGYVENPLKYFAHADIFILSSHVEGLPNVLVEAMMCGCTPVSTDCPTGPREVLKDGVYGYLVPVSQPIELSKAIELALDNRISRAALAEAVLPFEESAVIARHFEVLNIEMVNS